MRSKSFEGNNARRDTEYVRGRTHSSMRHSSWRNMQVYGLDKVFGGEGAPPYDAYLDKLKDPRWYAFTDLVKRNREHCEGCGSNRHLQVHHIRYLPGLEPWEHPLSEVRLLCVECHQATHRIEPTKVVVRTMKADDDLPAFGGSSSRWRRVVPLIKADLRQRIGGWVTVDGPVDDVRRVTDSSTYINLGGRFPRQILTVVILAANHAEFGDPLAFLGKKIRVEGRLQEYRGALQIVANVARQIELR